MAYKTSMDLIKALEKANELIRIKTKVSTQLEITEITDRISKQPDGGKALLFENNGSEFPILINAFGSEKRMKMILGIDNLDQIGQDIEALFKQLSSPKEGWFQKLEMLPQLGKISSWMPKKINGRGICQEIILQGDAVDLGMLPVLTTWPNDGGPFITLPMVNTIDPVTGIRNLGMYRMQIFDKKTTGMHWHRHKVGARHYQEYRKLGQKMPISVTLGGDPIYTYSATAPLPDHIDEYILSGFLRKQKVELVKCITNDIYVPKDVDFVIEGYVDPSEGLAWEGPFGDHTGFYSLADWYPKFHVTCITHRKNAIYPTTIVGIPPMEDAYIGKATERIFLSPIKLTMLPEVLDMDLPFAGVAHNITIIKIKKSFPGHAQKVMHSLWGAGQMMFNKSMIIVDENVDIHNYQQVIEAIYQNVNPETDIQISRGPVDVLDHASSKFAFGSKMGIDATTKLPEEMKPITIKRKYDASISSPLKANPIFEALGILILSIQKTDNFNFKEWVVQNQHFIPNSIKFVTITDESVATQDLFQLVWVVANHIDPLRDTYILDQVCYIDGTIKTKTSDGFDRDWPNPVVMDLPTIELVDDKWNSYEIGPFIQSPSRYYSSLMRGKGAVALNNSIESIL